MRILLAIDPRNKAIPYPAEDHDDGNQNIGFKDLKGAETEILAVPEIQDSPALRDALLALNQPHTPFFTVGCEKSLNQHQGQFWKRGFLEFSWNYAEYVVNAASYFPMFFHFNNHAQEFVNRHSIQFFWELQGARYDKIGKGGFSCCIWVTTGDYNTAQECEKVWDDALHLVTNYLMSVKPQPFSPIYGPQSAAG